MTPDVRGLLAALNAGHTDPKRLWHLLPAVSIPDDGQEHACVCGLSGFSAWDGDGFAYRAYGGLVVTDDEGRIVSFCRRCDRQLVAALHWSGPSEINEGENT